MLAWNGREYVNVCALTPHPAIGPRQELGDSFLAKLYAFLADDKRHYYRASDRSDLESFSPEMSPSDKGTKVFVPLADHIWNTLADWMEDCKMENFYYGSEFPACYAFIYDIIALGGKWKIG